MEARIERAPAEIVAVSMLEVARPDAEHRMVADDVGGRRPQLRSRRCRQQLRPDLDLAGHHGGCRDVDAHGRGDRRHAVLAEPTDAGLMQIPRQYRRLAGRSGDRCVDGQRCARLDRRREWRAPPVQHEDCVRDRVDPVMVERHRASSVRAPASRPGVGDGHANGGRGSGRGSTDGGAAYAARNESPSLSSPNRANGMPAAAPAPSEPTTTITPSLRSPASRDAHALSRRRTRRSRHQRRRQGSRPG